MKDNAILPEIEVFDLSHLHGARRLVDAGLMSERPHVQFVMGVKNAMPAEEHLLDILLAELKRVLPKATWTAAGIGVLKLWRATRKTQETVAPAVPDRAQSDPGGRQAGSPTGSS